MDYRCQKCRTQFSAPPSKKRRYCSQGCYNSARGVGEKTVVVACEECGGEYESYSRSRRKYCSVACRQRSVSVNVKVIACEHCGRSFKASVTLGRKYCGVACSDAAHSANGRAAVACHECGASFYTQKWRAGAGLSKYCGNTCRIKGRARSSIKHKVCLAGEEFSLSELADVSGVPRNTICSRLRRGYDVKHAAFQRKL